MKGLKERIEIVVFIALLLAVIFGGVEFVGLICMNSAIKTCQNTLEKVRIGLAVGVIAPMVIIGAWKLWERKQWPGL
ncbi:MAG: hypothetical protein QW680_13260 [Pyrobaculum sp.]